MKAAARKVRIGIWLFLLGLTTFLGGCGQGTDPLTVLNSVDPNVIGQGSLAFPLAAPTGTGYFTVQLGSGNEWILVGLSYTNGMTVRAPASGVVTALDASAGSITILHNARLSTRISGITPSSVTVGTYVLQGATIGIVIQSLFTSNGGVPFAVLLDNGIVCPLSFLSSTARQQIFTNGTISQLCPS